MPARPAPAPVQLMAEFPYPEEDVLRYLFGMRGVFQQVENMYIYPTPVAFKEYRERGLAARRDRLQQQALNVFSWYGIMQRLRGFTVATYRMHRKNATFFMPSHDGKGERLFTHRFAVHDNFDEMLPRVMLAGCEVFQ